MPELPDVEGFRRQLARTLPGRRIHHVDVLDPGVLRNATPPTFTRELTGRRFERPDRHGKWLILPTDGPTVLVHSGMTGHPYFARTGEDAVGQERLVLTLDRGEFRYADLRKLRGVWVAADDEDIAGVMGKQGPDALTMDFRAFKAVLHGRRGAVKSTMMDQSVIAGLGNLLTDEICWRAKVKPSKAVGDLDPEELRRLHGAMKSTLCTAVRHGCVPGLPRWLTRVRGDPDPSCPRCGTRLQRRRIAGRTSVWCPRCQPA
jgi:formamidopyrimidine-DNA glycosylase